MRPLSIRCVVVIEAFSLIANPSAASAINGTTDPGHFLSHAIISIFATQALSVREDFAREEIDPFPTSYSSAHDPKTALVHAGDRTLIGRPNQTRTLIHSATTVTMMALSAPVRLLAKWRDPIPPSVTASMTFLERMRGMPESENAPNVIRSAVLHDLRLCQNDPPAILLMDSYQGAIDRATFQKAWIQTPRIRRVLLQVLADLASLKQSIIIMEPSKTQHQTAASLEEWLPHLLAVRGAFMDPTVAWQDIIEPSHDGYDGNAWEGYNKGIEAQMRALGIPFDISESRGLLHRHHEISSRKMSCNRVLDQMIRAECQPIVDLLLYGDLDVRKIAAKAIEQLGPPVIPALVRSLQPSSMVIRQTAAHRRGILGFPRHCQPLLELLSDEFGKMLIEALNALPTTHDQWATCWIGALGLSDSSVRRRAVQELERLTDSRAVGPLLDLLGEKDWNVRAAAGRALRAVHEDMWVIGWVAALCWIRIDSCFSELAGRGDINACRAALALLNTRDISIDQWVSGLIAALTSVSPDIRIVAAEELGKLGAEWAIPDLENVTREDYYELQTIGHDGFYDYMVGSGEFPVQDAAQRAIDGIRAKKRLFADAENAALRGMERITGIFLANTHELPSLQSGSTPPVLADPSGPTMVGSSRDQPTKISTAQLDQAA